MTDILDQPLIPSSDSFTQSVADETVILETKHGVYYGLDAIGTIIWSALRDGDNPRTVCAAIAAEYDVDLATVEDDARALVDDLIRHEIVAVA